MRRVILKEGEQFKSSQINRTGAFNAGAIAAATSIIEEVRERGDAALRDFTAKFDGVEVEDFRVPQETIDAAAAQCDAKTVAALEHAAKQIREFHERQKQQSWIATRENGAIVGAKVTPLESVGIYVPGGRALYPSTVLMNAIPASVAGVERIACVTPPSKDLLGRRCPGCRRSCLRHRDHRAGCQDHRPRQRLRRCREEDRVGRCGNRHDRRPLRGVRRR